MVDTTKVMQRIQAYMETAAPVKAKKKPRLVRHRRPLGKWATKPVNRTSKVPKPTKLFAKKPGAKKPVKKPAAPALTAEQKMRWSKMSRAKQEQYLEKHPNSQFKKLGLNKATKPAAGKGGVAKTGTVKAPAKAPVKKAAPTKRANARPKTAKEKARAKRRVAALGRGGIEPGSKERAESALAIERDGPNVLKETLSEQEVKELGEDTDDLREGRELKGARRRRMAGIIGGLAVAAILVAGLSTISPGLAMVVGSQMMERLPEYMNMFQTEAALDDAEQSGTDASIELLCKSVAQYVADEPFPEDMLARLAEEAESGGEEGEE